MSEQIRAIEVLRRVKAPWPRGAEIGVFAGTMSEQLLDIAPTLYLYMVDSWLSKDEWPQAYRDTDDYHSKLSVQQQKNYWIMAREIALLHKNRCEIMRMDSGEAASKIEDGSLDFVFIDADHSYEGCSRDIAVWQSKIKPGGLLSGHDYGNLCHPYGVKRAVDEAIETKGWTLDLGENFTWFVQL